MNKYEFDALDKHAKTLLLVNDSTFVESIQHKGKWIDLYAHKDFFVEAYYDEDSKDLEKIAVVRTRGMEKYLSQIKLVL